MKRFTGIGLTLLLLALALAVVSSAPASAAPVLQGAVAIGGGEGHLCATLVGGQVRCWGVVGAGHLGDGTTGSSDLPIVVNGVTGATKFAGGATTRVPSWPTERCAAGASAASQRETARPSRPLPCRRSRESRELPL